jgi:hypothetical protein
MTALEHGAIERCKQDALRLAAALCGKHPGMGEPECMPKAQTEFSGHLLRGEKALRTQAFKSTLEPRSLA